MTMPWRRIECQFGTSSKKNNCFSLTHWPRIPEQFSSAAFCFILFLSLPYMKTLYYFATRTLVGNCFFFKWIRLMENNRRFESFGYGRGFLFCLCVSRRHLSGRRVVLFSRRARVHCVHTTYMASIAELLWIFPWKHTGTLLGLGYARIRGRRCFPDRKQRRSG